MSKTVSEQEALACLAHDADPILEGMIQRKQPLTRDTYIQGSWGADAFHNWDYEKEAELPECFQDEKACEDMIAESDPAEEET